MDPKLNVNEHLVTVTDDLKHIKENALSCMVDLPFTQSNDHSYYLCFSQGEGEYDLQQKNYSFEFSCWTEGYTCTKHSHDFTADALTLTPDGIGKSVWRTVGVLITPEKSSVAKRSIDITLSQIVNFIEGDAPICLYRLDKMLVFANYVLVDQMTLRKRKSALAIEAFSCDPVLIMPGDKVSFSWSLKGEKAIRIYPFMNEFSTNVKCPYVASVLDSTDVVLSARNFEREEVPEEQRSTVEKALHVVAREPEIRKLVLSAPGKPETNDLIATRGVPITLAWEVANLGAKALTLDPPVKAGPLKPKDTVTFTPQEDCVYTLTVAGKNPVRASVAMRLDEALIREFKPLYPSVKYGEHAYFTYKLKNVKTADISPGIPSLDVEADKANCVIKPEPPAREVVFTLSGKGITPSGAMTQLSKQCTVKVADYMEIKTFNVECDMIENEYCIKQVSWEIAYPEGDVEIFIYVDDQQLLHYTERSRLKHTEYINRVYRRNATLICTGRNGQTVKKIITK